METWPLKGPIKFTYLWKMGLSHRSPVNLEKYYSLYFKIEKLWFFLSEWWQVRVMVSKSSKSHMMACKWLREIFRKHRVSKHSSPSNWQEIFCHSKSNGRGGFPSTVDCLLSAWRSCDEMGLETINRWEQMGSIASLATRPCKLNYRCVGMSVHVWAVFLYIYIHIYT